MMISQIGSHNPHVNIVKIRCSAWFGPEATETIGGPTTLLIGTAGAPAVLWAVQPIPFQYHIPAAHDGSGYQPGGIGRVISPGCGVGLCTSTSRPAVGSAPAGGVKASAALAIAGSQCDLSHLILPVAGALNSPGFGHGAVPQPTGSTCATSGPTCRRWPKRRRLANGVVPSHTGSRFVAAEGIRPRCRALGAVMVWLVILSRCFRSRQGSHGRLGGFLACRAWRRRDGDQARRS